MGAQTANPMAEYLLKLQLIVSNTEFKNDEEARKYETLDSRLKGDEYVRAVTKTDMFENYTYADGSVYDILIQQGYEEDRVFFLMKNPMMIPADIKEILLDAARSKVITEYVEMNKYFSDLTGVPFVGTDKIEADPIITIPDGFYEQYQGDSVLMRGMPIHEMPDKYKELFLNSKYYQMTLDAYPDVKYLKYIGSNSIPIEISRKARDGDILKINTAKLSTHHYIFGNITVESDIVHAYTNVYRSTRDYVYQTLRGDFSSIYENYNDLIRYLTIYMSIGACLNEFQKKSNKLIYMNNVTANNLFTLYGLPSVIMEGAPMIEFLKKFRMILMDKGTNYVYRVKDLIGYGDTDIYTLVMVKQQEFENGKPKFDYNYSPPKPVYRIVFRRLGTADDNTSYFRFRESKEEYAYEEIRDADPRWWNTPEVEAMLNDMNYTLANSKYIQLSTHVSMSDIWWQTVIFLRGILDRKTETMNSVLTLNRDIDNASTMSLYDAILSLVVMMHWQLVDFQGHVVPGNMYIPQQGYGQCLDILFDGWDENKPLFKLGDAYKLASFNFDVRTTDKERWEAILDYEYMDPDYFIPKVEKVLDREDNNVGEVLMKDVKLIYDYIAEKVRTAVTIHDFRQATETYNTLFLVNPVRNWFTSDNRTTEDVICDKWKITDTDYYELCTFFTIPTIQIYNEEVGEYTEPPADLIIPYNDKYYYIYLWSVMNENATDILVKSKLTPFQYDDSEWLPGEYLFKDTEFVSVFERYLENELHESVREIVERINDSSLNQIIKENCIDIIIDKMNIDIGNNLEYGPNTFEYLLMMENTSLYDYIVDQRDHNPDEVITMMRSIIQALETYTSSSMASLSCAALGPEKYMSILKEVITYFKSYMVEFTRDEFRYIFGGILDNGGNSDMLNLIDEMSHGNIEISPSDSLALFDVSHADAFFGMADDNVGFIFDEALFRVSGKYQTFKQQSDFTVWYDDGKRITMNPSFTINDDDEVVGNFVKKGSEYMVILNVKNVNNYPPGYYGNVL